MAWVSHAAAALHMNGDCALRVHTLVAWIVHFMRTLVLYKVRYLQLFW